MSQLVIVTIYRTDPDFVNKRQINLVDSGYVPSSMDQLSGQINLLKWFY